MLAELQANKEKERNGLTAGRDKLKVVTDAEKKINAENRVIIKSLQAKPVGE